MDRTCAVRAVVCVLAIVSVVSQPVSAGEPDYDSIADKLVNQLAGVQPAEVVVITGNADQQALLEALVAATWKAGGQPTVVVNFPQANKNAIMEMPIEYMKFPNWFGVAQARLVDCFINVASIQDPALFADVPEERFEAFRQGGTVLQRANQYNRFRSVTLGQTGGVPTAAYAASQNADFEAMTTMFWKAVDTDYGALRESAKFVASTLASGDTVRVTSEIGTDITFAVEDVAPRVNCGRPDDNTVASGPMSSWVPAGEAYAEVRAGSANGTVVVPHLDFRGIPMKNVKMSFADGLMTDLSSESDLTMLREFLTATTGDSTMLSIVDVGLNPNSHPIEGSAFSSWEMGGMVTLGMGNNSWAGGSNMASDGLTFHLPGATLAVGETTICEKGKLVTPG
jgi:leucyl aminopeptidase (aminopeptidase T)